MMEHVDLVQSAPMYQVATIVHVLLALKEIQLSQDVLMQMNVQETPVDEMLTAIICLEVFVARALQEVLEIQSIPVQVGVKYDW